MSRPKNYWNQIIKKMVMRYPSLKDDESIQAGIFCHAIEIAIVETRDLANGENRIKAVEDVFFNRTKTCDGAALDLNFSRRTVQYWLNDFINLVGKKAGF